MVDFSKFLKEKTNNANQSPDTNVILSFPIKGIVTDCYDGTSYEKDLIVEIRKSDHFNGKHVLHLFGGPTGCESFVMNDLDMLKKLTKLGWTACMGTEKRWDKLEIPPEEMMVVYQKIKDLY